MFTTPTITVKGDALATPLGGWRLAFETPAQFSSLEDKTPATPPLRADMLFPTLKISPASGGHGP